MKAQGSKEWHTERSVRLTASRFGDIMAAPKTKRYQNYMQEKINELSGVPYMSDDSPWFNHGKELEPFARDRYDFEMSLKGQPDIEQVFFVVHPEYDFIGCSPDGCIKSLNKGIEIKSSISHSAYQKNVKKGLPSNHKPQVQGQIWICGYDSTDFICFFRDPDGRLKDEINIVNVLPDLDYHKKLEQKCIEFFDNIKVYGLKK